MAEIILIRHCATSGQRPEAELTDEGVRSAAALVETLAALAPDAIYSSPYRRAVATIEPYARHAGLTPKLDARFRERELAAQEHDWREHQRRSFDDPDYRLPGGESLREARARALSALAEITAQRALVVSHGTLIASLLGYDFDAWHAMPNPAISRVRLEDLRG